MVGELAALRETRSEHSDPTCTGVAGRIPRMQRTAVVTGASSGIGAAAAERLAREGYHVVLAARRLGRLEEVAARIADSGGSAQVSGLDVTDRKQFDEFASALPTCDVLVANAG